MKKLPFNLIDALAGRHPVITRGGKLVDSIRVEHSDVIGDRIWVKIGKEEHSYSPYEKGRYWSNNKCALDLYLLDESSILTAEQEAIKRAYDLLNHVEIPEHFSLEYQYVKEELKDLIADFPDKKMN